MLRAFAQAFLKRSPNISPTCRPASGQMGRLIPWFLRRLILNPEKGEILGGLLGNIWAAWLHVRTLAVAAPARGHGFGRELMKRAELYAVERGCTDAFLDTFSFQARPFYEKLGYRVFGMLENHPAGHQHYFMTKQLNCAK
jgi:GNAT superfamily N-acetyltransferase